MRIRVFAKILKSLEMQICKVKKLVIISVVLVLNFRPVNSRLNEPASVFHRCDIASSKRFFDFLLKN